MSNDTKALFSLIDLVAIVVGAWLIGDHTTAAIGWGVGLVALGVNKGY